VVTRASQKCFAFSSANLCSTARTSVGFLEPHPRLCHIILKIRFRKVREEGVAAVIRRRKLEEVCHMLRETDLPIGEIAARCGFPVPTHLNALFRRTFGTTLRAYRTSSHNP
jgi:hypothetical protein